MILRLEKPKVDSLGVKKVGEECIGIASYGMWFVGAGMSRAAESVDSDIVVLVEGRIRTRDDNDGSVDIYQICKTGNKSAIELRVRHNDGTWDGVDHLTLLLWFIPNDLIIFREIR